MVDSESLTGLPPSLDCVLVDFFEVPKEFLSHVACNFRVGESDLCFWADPPPFCHRLLGFRILLICFGKGGLPDSPPFSCPHVIYDFTPRLQLLPPISLCMCLPLTLTLRSLLLMLFPLSQFFS